MSKETGWILLFIAGILEIVWIFCLKYTDGFSKFWPSVTTLIASGMSLYLLEKSTQVLPLGIAYSVWVGIGAVGAVAVGVFYFKESWSPVQVLFVVLLISSIIGLKFTAQT
jgi:quaternary ammonium compound-resistance protein SugE